MVLLEDVNPRDMEALERQAQSDLKWSAKMEAELASIDRRDKISGILQRLEGSDSEVEEVLGEAAMEVMEQEDLQAEEKWVRQVEEARRRRQQLKQIAARVEESRSARDTAAKRRHAMATDALDNPPWLEGPTDSRRHFSGKVPPHMQELVDKRAAQQKALEAAKAEQAVTVLATPPPPVRKSRCAC